MSDTDSFATLRPDGGRVEIAADIRNRLMCGVLEMTDVEVADGPAVAAATEVLGESLRSRYAGKLPSEIPGLQEARDLYKSFGMDPSRHRPSSEALLRRVLKGQSLYRISNVVDACNLASLSFLLPIGLYDADLVQGDVLLRVGRKQEEYAGIRKGDVHLEGRLGLFDSQGPFGSPTSDSVRTCTAETTTRLLAVIMATAGYDRAAMIENLNTFSELFTTHCRARETFRAVLGDQG